MDTETELNIRAIRDLLGLNQSEFARELGIHQGTVSAWENEKHRPTRAARKAIERLLAEKGKAA